MPVVLRKVVTIATRLLLMPIVLRKVYSKYEHNRTEEKGVIDLSLWLPWQPSYPSIEVCG